MGTARRAVTLQYREWEKDINIDEKQIPPAIAADFAPGELTPKQQQH